MTFLWGDSRFSKNGGHRSKNGKYIKQFEVINVEHSKFDRGVEIPDRNEKKLNFYQKQG